MFLRQSTASQEIVLGRFLDSTDGDTEETALTIANTDIKLWKHGATTLASKNSGGATHIANGNYSAILDATDTDTIGNLEVHVHVSGALAVKREYVVLDEAVYDWLFGTVAPNTTAPLDAAGVRSAVGLGTANLDTQLSTIDANVDSILVDTAEIGAAGAGLTEAGGTGDQFTAIPWNAVWDAEVQSEATDALIAYDPPTNAEMEARTLLAASYATAANQTTIAAYIDTEVAAILAAVDTEVAAIKAKTDNIPADPADASDIAALIDALPTAAEVATAVFTTAMTESYRATGAAPTLAQSQFEIMAHLGEFAISGTTKTTKKLDGSTTAKTYTLDDADTPTSITETT